MLWTTVPGIEYEVFLAAIPVPSWKPRFAMPGTVLGDSLSTLYCYKREDGCVGFMSHEPNEMTFFQGLIQEYFVVEVRTA